MSNVAVYAKGSTDFTTQGLGILSDVKSSQTTQTVSDGGNVTSQLELEYPVNGRLVDKLIEGNFIRVSMATDSSKYMVYEISDTLKDDSGTITVYADPYSDRIGRMSFENGGKFGSYSTVQAALTYAKSQMKDFPSSFQLTSNISKSVDFTKDGIIPNFKKFLDLLNTKVSGNVYYGLNIIQIYSALGKDRSDIILRDDRNTSSVKVKTDYSSIINRIIPVLPVLDKDGNATQETKVGTPVISKTPNQFIDYWSASAIQLDTQDLANTYFDRTHADRPVQTVDVDPLSMSEDFSDIDIFDRVQIYSSRLNYTDKLRVSSRVIDNLTGQVIKFSLGNASVSIYNTIEGQTQSVLNQIQAITSIVISASGKNQTYVSNIQPTSANEGDMWIQEDGDYKAFWVYKDGDWVRLVDSDTQKAITDGVAAAIEQAKLDAQGLVDSNNTVIRSEMQTVATQKAKDEIAKGNFNATAQAYADSAQSAAIAQAQSLVSTQAQQAAKDLSDARLSIQNDIDLTNGNVKSLTDRADGWDATVVKVNGLSTGDRNYILDTANPKTQTSNGTDNQDINIQAKFYSPIKNWGIANGDYIISFDWTLKTALSSDMQASVFFNGSPYQQQFYTVKSGQLTGHVDLKFKLDSGILTANPDITGLRFRIMSQMASGNTITYSSLFMKSGTINTTWTPAPEDLSAASAQAQLTADKAALDLKNYQVSNDGSVEKAQSDITVIAGKVETKVSKVDYDSNNKTLNQNISTATQTATQAQTTINNYKTATDGKLQTMSGQIDTVAGSVQLAATKIELNTAKGEFSSQVASVKADYDAVTQSVSTVTGKLNDLLQQNLVVNSDMRIDYSGWHVDNPWGGALTTSRGNLWNNGLAGEHPQAMYVWHDMGIPAGNNAWIYSEPIPVYGGLHVSAAIWATTTNKTATEGTPLSLYMRVYDANKNIIASQGHDILWSELQNGGSFKKYINRGLQIPSGGKYVSLVFAWNSSGTVSFGMPMLVKGDDVGDYVSGNYANNDKIALQQITIDSISNIVSNPTTGLSVRVQTAEGLLTTVKSTADGAESKAEQLAGQFNQEVQDRTTGDSNTLTQAKSYTQSQINSAVSGVNSTITQTANAILASVESTNLVINSEFEPNDGTWYVLSGGGAAGSTVGAAWSAPITTAFLDWAPVNGSRLITYNVNTWYTTALVSGQDNSAYSASIVAGRSQNTTNSVSTALDFRIGWWDKDKKLIGTASGDNIIDGSSYKGIQKYVLENKIAPTGTAYVSVIIAHSSANATDIVSRPNFNRGTTASPYIPTYGTEQSSTILSLLKNNWSIGITDNISNIVSGIAGNSSQMAIISDKVIIKSPNTQITGTAWINSAMIANGAIGTAQIGDASITSAKILALDVNKLSGNISNFIQSNWNGDYGSVSISSWGMTVTTEGVNTEFNSAGMELTYANELTGGIGVNTWENMPNSFQGLYFGLNGVGDFMSFGARDNNVQSGMYTSKLAWMRGGSWARPSGMSAGWTFMDDVKFNNQIIPQGSSNQKLVIDTHTFNNNGYPYFGDSRDGAGFSFGSSQVYLHSDNYYYNLTSVIKAFSGLGALKIPSSIRSDGTVANWWSVST